MLTCKRCGNSWYSRVLEPKTCKFCQSPNWNKTVLVKRILNRRFGRWLVLSFISKGSRGGSKLWLCECDCGTIKSVKETWLLSGRYKSCGCLKNENSRNRLLTHGNSSKPEYSVWRSMKSRCYSLKNNSYHDYGGRGITVCDRWLDSFENFLEDMGERPEGTELDRKENDGNYEPSNCKWSTKTANCQNKRNSKYLTVNGETLTLSEWTRRTGIKTSTLQFRISNNWDPVRTVNEKVRSWRLHE